MKSINQIALALTAVMLSACNAENNKGQAADEAVRVEVTQVKTATSDRTSRYSGTVEEESGTLLSFAVGGTVSRVLVDEGDRVGKGQLIATLYTEQLTHNHASAQAALAQAEDAYRRMEELHGKGSLPEIKWVEAQTALQRARASEQMARKQLADCRLYAPFSGVISKKFAEKGKNVGAGTQIAKLVAVGRMKVKISVPESEMAQISIGQKADVTIEALGGASMQATVTEKGVAADPLSRSYDVKLSLPKADRKLLPGMVADVALRGGNASMACILPAHIVQIDENNNEFVWLAVGGKAVKRIVTVGGFTADGVTVTSGLADGDMVITAGAQKVSEGMRVEIK